MNGALIGRPSLIDAGAIATERKSFPAHSLILGAPLEFVRDLTDVEISNLAANGAICKAKARVYGTELEVVVR